MTQQDLARMQTEKERLDRAFELVCDPKDWRAPIDKVLHPEDLTDIRLEDVVEAVAFFTATTATVTPVEALGQTVAVLVKADGYRKGPAGP